MGVHAQWILKIFYVYCTYFRHQSAGGVTARRTRPAPLGWTVDLHKEAVPLTVEELRATNVYLQVSKTV